MKAPCGHDGIPVTVNYATCPRCDTSDGVPVHVEPQKTEPMGSACSHLGQYLYAGYLWCEACGARMGSIADALRI